MSIFEKLFGNAPKQAVAAPAQQQPMQQAQPGNLPATPQVASATNPTVPATSVAATTSTNENKSPLDGFNDLWKDTPNTNGDQTPAGMFNVDPARLLEAAQKNNFMKIVPQELLGKITAGGEEAQAALPQVLNLLASNTFAQSAQATAKIVETALAKQREDFQAMLPGLIKQQSVSESLKAENPIFKHPAAAPMLDALQDRLATKHPDATGAELQTMAKDFLLQLAEAANPKKAQADSASKGKSVENWQAFLQQ